LISRKSGTVGRRNALGSRSQPTLAAAAQRQEEKRQEEKRQERERKQWQRIDDMTARTVDRLEKQLEQLRTKQETMRATLGGPSPRPDAAPAPAPGGLQAAARDPQLVPHAANGADVPLSS